MKVTWNIIKDILNIHEINFACYWWAIYPWTIVHLKVLLFNNIVLYRKKPNIEIVVKINQIVIIKRTFTFNFWIRMRIKIDRIINVDLNKVINFMETTCLILVYFVLLIGDKV